MGNIDNFKNLMGIHCHFLNIKIKNKRKINSRTLIE
jgi:hypothetical protein